MVKSRTCKICKTKKKIEKFSVMGRVCYQCQSIDESSVLHKAVKRRRCLMCDTEFLSTGNRKCNSCNSTYHDGVYSSVSCFISVGA